jgi:predicted small lipoprotein YifL
MHSVETPSRPTPRAVLCAAVACVFLALGGVSCGQRGPLYLPETQPVAPVPPAAKAQPDEPSQEQPAADASAASSDRDEKDDEATP